MKLKNDGESDAIVNGDDGWSTIRALDWLAIQRCRVWFPCGLVPFYHLISLPLYDSNPKIQCEFKNKGAKQVQMVIAAEMKDSFWTNR